MLNVKEQVLERPRTSASCQRGSSNHANVCSGIAAAGTSFVGYRSFQAIPSHFMKACNCQLLAVLAFVWTFSFKSADGAVNLRPGDNIQSMVNANPGNSTFLFSAGTYSRQSIVPKTGNVFDGQGVAILDGGNQTTRAFGGTASNVTIKNLTIQRYNSASQNAAVDCASGNAWTVTNCLIQFNASVGVKVGNNSRIINNRLDSNSQAGFSGGGGGWLMKNNQINNNNTSHQNWTSGAGGGKITGATGGTFDGNNVTNNDGPGIWLVDADSVIIKSNIFIGNYGPGIMVEISKHNAVSNNLCFGNGIGSTNWSAAQILVSTSASNSVCANTLGVPFGYNGLSGIFILDQARNDARGNPIHATGNEVYANDAWFWDTKPGIQGCATDESYPVYANNHFRNNTYHVASTSVNYFSWENDYTLAQAHARGHETGSTIDTNMTPRLALSRVNNLITLSWPSWAYNFKLWSTTNPSSSSSWSLVINPVALTTVQFSLTLGILNSPRLFRLKGPADSLAMGLIAHYTFDEQCTNSAAGCVQDNSCLGNNGTLGSATFGRLPQAPIWTPTGKFGGAYLYNGMLEPGIIVPTIGEGIYLPQGVDVDGNWTLSVWAKLNNVTNNTSGTIYCQKQSTEDCRNLLIHWEGDLDQTMTLQVRDSACHELMLHNLPSNPMVAGQWYHLVGVGNNKTYSFYINGMLQQSQLVANMGPLSSDSHTVGMMFDDFGQYYNHYLNGSIDELRIYNRALSATEILALYNGGSFP